MRKKVWAFTLASALIVTSMPQMDKPAVQAAESGGVQAPLRTVYDKPAGGDNWYDEMIPLGNGMIGASVYGGVESDEILINEKTLWSGGAQEYSQQYSNYQYDGGFASPSGSLSSFSQQFQSSWKKARIDLQQAVNGHSANGNEDYDIPWSVENTINQMKGDKTEFGSYQELGSIMMEDPNYITPEITRVWTDKEHKDGVNGSQSSACLFDGNAESKFFADSAGTQYTAPYTIEWDYNAPKYINSYNFITANDMPGRDPVVWKLYASTQESGENYVLIDDRIEYGEKGRFHKTTYWLNQSGASGSYRRFRLVVTETRDGSPLQIGEFEINKEGGTSNYSSYRRSLDLNTAEATVSYANDGVDYLRTYFVSHPNNVMVVKLEAKNGTINRYFRLTSEQKNKTIESKVESDGSAVITMEGQPTPNSGWKMKTGFDQAEYFAQEMKIIPTGGNIYTKNNGVEVDNASSILVIMSCGTNYKPSYSESFTDFFTGVDPMIQVHENVSKAAAKGYDTLKKEHETDYRNLFDRVKLNIGTTSVPTKTTDQLFAGYQKGNTESEDRYLETLYYQFGRYLLIAGSREDSKLPTNLQGIWADGLTPPWSADFHTNVNLQMNYWLAESTNLAETHLPTIEYVKSLVEKGKIGVQNSFGTNEQGKKIRGWTIWHENNAWGNVGPSMSSAFYAPECAAWMCRDIWDYYEFNQDKKFLEENYDLLKQAALFWVDTLWTDTRDNTLVANPSYSPEHGPYSLGATYVQSVVWGLFDEVEQASNILGISDNEVNEIKNAKSRLSGLKIGSAGQLQEWKDDTQLDISGDNGHRHENHLYALHPGDQVVTGRSEQDDTYAEAMRKTLETRGDGGTGWSKAWKINLWARLLDGEHAYTMVGEILKQSTLTNLLDVHPPFQIDGNYGSTSGMTEMLLQSQGGIIKLLPALPSKWASGSVSGLKARGNVEVNMAWSNRSLASADLKVYSDGEITVSAPNIGNSKLTKNGATVSYERVDNDIIKISAKAGDVYQVSDVAPQQEFATYAGNPIITSIYTADPSAHVWKDGKLYVYASHDMDPARGCDLMDRYHIFSTEDMVTWVDEGEVLSSSELDWGIDGFMWAPDCAYKNGKYYFYYPHPSGPTHDDWGSSWKIGVATSDKPNKDFVDQGYIQDLAQFSLIDPCVFQDDDGNDYIYIGGGNEVYGGKLGADMMSVDGAMKPMEGLEDFHEATWVFKRNGIYYCMYADNLNGANRLRYATSSSPLGPWDYKGILLDSVSSYTSHGSVVEFKGQWYLFYHNQAISNQGELRSVCVDKLQFNTDGTIKQVVQTTKGVQAVGVATDMSKYQNKYYANQFTAYGGAIVRTDASAEGGYVIGEMQIQNSYAEIQNVDGGKGGRANAKIHYASDETLAKVRLNVNGKDYSLLNMPRTGGWSSFNGQANITVELQPGETNTIKILTNGSGTNIDYIVVTKMDEEETVVEQPTEVPTEKPTESQSSNVGIEINGYQISTVLEGYRIVYSVIDPNNEVSYSDGIAKVGMLYGVASKVSKDDMIIESKNSNVRRYEATSQGKLDVTYSQGENVQSYARTMKFLNPPSASYFSAQMYVRAYVQLKDGTYIYSNVEAFTIYDVAHFLYQNILMNNKDSHNYLYTNILSIVDKNYKQRDFAWNNSVVKPDKLKKQAKN